MKPRDSYEFYASIAAALLSAAFLLCSTCNAHAQTSGGVPYKPDFFRRLDEQHDKQPAGLHAWLSLMEAKHRYQQWMDEQPVNHAVEFPGGSQDAFQEQLYNEELQKDHPYKQHEWAPVPATQKQDLAAMQQGLDELDRAMDALHQVSTPVPAAPAAQTQRVTVHQIANHRSTNFIVSGPFAQEVAEKCEADRASLAEQFLGAKLPDWREPAVIEVTDQGGGLFGGGSTSFAFDEAARPIQITGRWIGTREQLLENVIPHEVMHTVLASHFGRPLPRWYDEGAAMSVESDVSHQFQRKTIVEVLNSGRGIAFNDFLTAMQYPPDVHAFYSQAHSVCTWLILLHGPADYIRFGESAFKTGRWSDGLSEVYGIADASDFQTRWVDWLKGGGRWDVGQCQYIGGGWTCQPPRQPARPAPVAPVAPRPPSSQPAATPAPACDPRAIAAAVVAQLEANPDKFRGCPGPQGPAGPKGDRGEPGKPCTCDSSKITAEVVGWIEANREKFRGPAGEPGKAGPPGPAGPAGSSGAAPAVVRHFVLVGDPGADYYSRLEREFSDTKTRFDKIILTQPPADRSIGTLPCLVLYSGATPVLKFHGTSDVYLQLARIRRGEFQ